MLLRVLSHLASLAVGLLEHVTEHVKIVRERVLGPAQRATPPPPGAVTCQTVSASGGSPGSRNSMRSPTLAA